MNKTKFVANLLSENITKREIVRETDKTIFYLDSAGKERVERKVGNWTNWFNSSEEAKQFLINYKTDEIGRLEKKIERERMKLVKINDISI